jgi:hypothetical protein
MMRRNKEPGRVGNKGMYLVSALFTSLFLIIFINNIYINLLYNYKSIVIF